MSVSRDLGSDASGVKAGPYNLLRLLGAISAAPATPRPMIGTSSLLVSPGGGLEVKAGAETWLVIHPTTLARIEIEADAPMIQTSIMRPLCGVPVVNLDKDHAAMERVAGAMRAAISSAEQTSTALPG